VILFLECRTIPREHFGCSEVLRISVLMLENVSLWRRCGIHSACHKRSKRSILAVPHYTTSKFSMSDVLVSTGFLTFDLRFRQASHDARVVFFLERPWLPEVLTFVRCAWPELAGRSGCNRRKGLLIVSCSVRKECGTIQRK
jgi:hypothetical protein